MSGLRIKAFSPGSRMKRVAPSVRKRVDLPVASAMKANSIVERYSLEEREQIAEILRILSAKPQQFRLQFLGVADVGPSVQNEPGIWASDQRAFDHVHCTVFEQNSDFCSV